MHRDQTTPSLYQGSWIEWKSMNRTILKPHIYINVFRKPYESGWERRRGRGACERKENEEECMRERIRVCTGPLVIPPYYLLITT